MISYKDLCILKLTGVAKKYNKREFIIPEEMMKDCGGDFFTYEFLKGSKYIIRSYWKNGNKWWEREYKSGQRHGKSIFWSYDGKQRLESYWKNGRAVRINI